VVGSNEQSCQFGCAARIASDPATRRRQTRRYIRVAGR
jgi:hypothetical protein